MFYFFCYCRGVFKFILLSLLRTLKILLNMSSTIKLYRYSWTELKTYVLSALFISGNILLPQIAHLVPQGGLIFLPIYFFTLLVAYKYGMAAGIMTAVLSPLINHLLFGMPPLAVLPVLLFKSVTLAVLAALVASKSQKLTMFLLALVVVGYQVVGGAFEWLYVGEFSAALQDFTLGWPGMSLQLLGGYVALKWMMKK